MVLLVPFFQLEIMTAVEIPDGSDERIAVAISRAWNRNDVLYGRAVLSNTLD